MKANDKADLIDGTIVMARITSFRFFHELSVSSLKFVTNWSRGTSELLCSLSPPAPRGQAEEAESGEDE